MAWTTADRSRRSCGRTCSSRNHGHSATTASTESRRRPRLTKLRQTLSSAPFLQPSRRTSWPRRLKSQRRKTAVSHRPESGRTWMWSLKIGAAPERHEAVPGHREEEADHSASARAEELRDCWPDRIPGGAVPLAMAHATAASACVGPGARRAAVVVALEAPADLDEVRLLGAARAEPHPGVAALRCRRLSRVR